MISLPDVQLAAACKQRVCTLAGAGKMREMTSGLDYQTPSLFGHTFCGCTFMHDCYSARRWDRVLGPQYLLAADKGIPEVR